MLHNNPIVEQNMLERLTATTKRLEGLWRQKSRAKWLKEGDLNTRFFHNVARGRAAHNQISGFGERWRSWIWHCISSHTCSVLINGNITPTFKTSRRLHQVAGGYMASLATAEACDSNLALLATGELRVLQPVFQIYGQRQAFSGPVVTLKVFEDNVLVREMLETKGEGRVLVVDGGGSMRCALVGGNLGQLAQNNGWSGIVVNGCIRDVDEINGCDIGVRALASHPSKSNKRGIGDKRVPVYVAGAFIHDGEWLYADSDGILISKSELSV